MRQFASAFKLQVMPPVCAALAEGTSLGGEAPLLELQKPCSTWLFRDTSLAEACQQVNYIDQTRRKTDTLMYVHSVERIPWHICIY